jgi:hypothetical protein
VKHDGPTHYSPIFRLYRTGRDVLRVARRDVPGAVWTLLSGTSRERRHVLIELQEALEQKWDWTRPALRYEVDPDRGRRLHAILKEPWPCPLLREFREVYGETVATLRNQGISDAHFGSWLDGDIAFAESAWCIIRHRNAEHVVETGVGRGVTTRCMLEALDRSDKGRLFSIELAPQLQTNLKEQVGVAVPQHLRDRWTLLEGSSRQHLPGLLQQLGTIQLFAHDSRHTTRNVRFELGAAWPHLVNDGCLLVDDVGPHRGLQSFLSTVSGYDLVLARSAAINPSRGLFAIVHKRVQ